MRFSPYATGAGAGSSCKTPGKSHPHATPTAVTTSNVQKANARMTKGSESVRPYSMDSGLNSGAVMANARIVPPAILARLISRATGITPSEQIGKSMPINQACGTSRHVPQPNKRRVFS